MCAQDDEGIGTNINVEIESEGEKQSVRNWLTSSSFRVGRRPSGKSEKLDTAYFTR